MSYLTTDTLQVDVDGTAIGYRRIGHGPPIVAVTRMRGTLDTWDPKFIDALATTHTVITVDYPGVAYSQGAFPGSFGEAAAFVDAFAHAVSLERYAVLGWSWGGVVAQALVADRPERLTHAIFLATNPIGPLTHEIEPAFLERAFKPVNDADDNIVLFFEPDSARSRQAAGDSYARIYARPDVDAKIPSSEAQIHAYLAVAKQARGDEARREALKRSTVPILVLCGDHDISTQAANWFPLSNQLSTAQMLVLPDAGHGPHHQYPELSARYIAGFIALA